MGESGPKHPQAVTEMPGGFGTFCRPLTLPGHPIRILGCPVAQTLWRCRGDRARNATRLVAPQPPSRKDPFLLVYLTDCRAPQSDPESGTWQKCLHSVPSSRCRMVMGGGLVGCQSCCGDQTGSAPGTREMRPFFLGGTLESKWPFSVSYMLGFLISHKWFE